MTVILMPGSPPVHAAAGASPAGRDFKPRSPELRNYRLFRSAVKIENNL